MRDTLFISHATPEDNEFTIWLASRLELLGYKVWIDKNELLGGERFWNDIETIITKNAVKFLMVYSNDITNKTEGKEIKNGIKREIDFANQVIAENPGLKDFFTILHIDNAPRNLFSGASDLNQISFETNWAEGFSFLIKKLEKDQVPKIIINDHTNAAKFYLDDYLVKNPIIEKKELYYTNWWSAKSLPEYFYIHRFTNEGQAKAVFDKNKNIISFRAANSIITFSENIDLNVEGKEGAVDIQKKEIFNIKISNLLIGYEKDTFPSYRDSENYFKRLMKRTLHVYLRQKRMCWYELASKDLAYYHAKESLPSGKIEFNYPMQEKKKKKNLYGKNLDIGKWHFAFSFKAVLNPYPGFHLKSHLIFTDTHQVAIPDKTIQHSLRRKKGKRMFNEEWRDLMLAFLASLKNNDGQMILETNGLAPLIMKNDTELFWSDYGYYDPKDRTRMEIFSNDRELEEIAEDEK